MVILSVRVVVLKASLLLPIQGLSDAINCACARLLLCPEASTQEPTTPSFPLQHVPTHANHAPGSPPSTSYNLFLKASRTIRRPQGPTVSDSRTVSFRKTLFMEPLWGRKQFSAATCNQGQIFTHRG